MSENKFQMKMKNLYDSLLYSKCVDMYPSKTEDNVKEDA